VATALLVHRKRPSRKALTLVRARPSLGAIATTVAHVLRRQRMRKATMTMIHSLLAILRMTFNLAPMPIWVPKAV